MYLGIEIGGTKLQLGIGTAAGVELVELRRLHVRSELGAAGIREQIAAVGAELIEQYPVERIGIGFGGPVDPQLGRTIKSHQVEGWSDFPLVEWCQATLGRPTVIGNDCDLASLAESRRGAGRGRRSVFYVTVGTGIGGGCVIDGQLLGRDRPAIAEIGHLRPGPGAVSPHCTVESLASGPAISAAVRHVLIERRGTEQLSPDVEDLYARCQHDPARLTTVHVGAAARDGNQLAQSAVHDAVRVLGWAIAQVITLLAPECVVVGGGVSLLGDHLFLEPLRRETGVYVFPPLANSYEIVPAALGGEVVVHGALVLAASSSSGGM